MKIVIVTHNVVKGDGQGRVCFEIARRALQSGCSVTLVADRIDEDLVGMGAEWVPVQPQLLRKINLVKCFSFARSADAMLRGPVGASADIIHACGYTLSVDHHVNNSQFVHASWLRSPVHSARVERGLGAAYQWTYSTMNARWEKTSYARAARVVAASDTVADELRSIGVADERLSVIVNGVDLDEFRPEPKQDRASLGLPAGVVLSAFVGDIRLPRKNLDSVLRALVDVPAMHLAVVGRVTGSPYPRLTAELGIADRVHFLDFRRDVPAILRACDLFVFPSHYEPWGSVVLEAMASGLPVIVSANMGSASAVTPDCGIVLPRSDDVAGMARAMSELAGDPEQRRRMGEAARERARDYSWDKIADQYMAVYAQCAGTVQ